MTAAQIAANRAEAIKIVRAAQGLNDTPSSWTYDQRTRYNNALATYFLTHPEKFGSQDLNTAERVVKNPAQPLEDTSFDWGMFAAEAVKPAGDALKSVGDGAFTVAAMSRYVLPLAALVAVVILLKAFARQTGAVK